MTCDSMALVWTPFNPHWLGICWKQNVQTKLWPFWAFQLKDPQCLCSCLRSTYPVRNNSGFYGPPSALTPTNSRGHHSYTFYQGRHLPGYGSKQASLWKGHSTHRAVWCREHPATPNLSASLKGDAVAFLEEHDVHSRLLILSGPNLNLIKY